MIKLPIKAFLISMAFMFVVAVIKLPETNAQADLMRVYSASFDSNHLTFYAGDADGNQHEVGMLPPNFGINTLSTAEWLVLSIRSFKISPEGERVAFIAQREQEYALFIFEPYENSLRQVTIPVLGNPIWSPDSTAILIAYAPDAYVYEIESDQLIQITSNSDDFGVNSAWTLDSSAFVYVGLQPPCIEPCRLVRVSLPHTSTGYDVCIELTTDN